MAHMTAADLQQMKADGKKIAAAVVYEFQMTKICERAGVDLLSVGDSLGRNVLGHDHVDECTVDDMIPFARAVVRARDRAVVSVDLPTTPSRGGPKEVGAAARRFKQEARWTPPPGSAISRRCTRSRGCSTRAWTARRSPSW